MLRASLILFLLAIAAGCEAPYVGPPLVPVAGVVTLDGLPLPNAGVQFIPQGETLGQTNYAKTDVDGKFELVTTDRKHKGAPVGSYKVVVSKYVNPDGTDFVPTAETDPMSSAFKELLPATYSDPVHSILKAQVPAGGAASLEFKLTSKPPH